MNDLRHTAIHEAGHAVIGRVLNMVCGSVSIKADEDSAGHSITADRWQVVHEWELQGRFREMSTIIDGRILAFMAGAEAEVEILARDHRNTASPARSVYGRVDGAVA